MCLTNGTIKLALPSTKSRLNTLHSNDSSTPTILAMIGRVTVLNISILPSHWMIVLNELPLIVTRNLFLPNNAIRVSAFRKYTVDTVYLDASIKNSLPWLFVITEGINSMNFLSFEYFRVEPAQIYLFIISRRNSS